ncbi:MAG: F0F1 ATP synthase subunit A, partial [Hyphomicrobiales bacterium]
EGAVGDRRQGQRPKRDRAATIIAPLPLLLAVALTALEFLVAFLQAYVFAILTCVYLNDALHPGH